MKDSYKFWTLICSGFLTLIMAATLSSASAEASMMFMITVPFFMTLGVVFAFAYRFISKKINDMDVKEITFAILLFFMIAFNFLAYPF
ncbi:hypothetical protein SAMN04515667_0053 [Formosa sp. Hel1_31_208]|uniref:hypothetical protein n=1 Tax=Formosa sp. Hel1_31_208 TaxID=1798225 RepID=UPI00087B1773|nr:hypothetical protein [Formosa sp. Hel1_31_208]SDR65793.1 hypothetical protein SAMN04515667_0053 [Formosa sp. Hel1_31_208]